MNPLETLAERAAAHHRRTGRPLVTLTYAQSLDGSIAIRPGVRTALSSPETKRLTHQLRAVHDAILVGIGTVLADDPRLTARLVAGRNPQPVVLDSRLRCPSDARLLQNPQPPWIATTSQADRERQAVLESAGARVLRLPDDGRGRVSLPDLLDCLGTMGMCSLMVEGGAHVITAFLTERLVDWLVLTIAPLFLGGLGAVGNLGLSDLGGAPRLSRLEYQQIGPDLVVWGDLDWEI